MQVSVVSRNQVAASGLAAIAARSNLHAEVVSLDDIARMRESDLTLFYCDAWDEECRRDAVALYQARVPFLVISGGTDPNLRHEALAAGAIYAFGRNQMDELAMVFANMSWSVRRPSHYRFKLANGFEVDLVRQRVYRGKDRYLEFSPTECGLLAVLYERSQETPHKPIPPADINVALWGSTTARSEGTLRAYISQLRAKIEVDPVDPTVLHGRRGHGYWLEPAVDESSAAPEPLRRAVGNK